VLVRRTVAQLSLMLGRCLTISRSFFAPVTIKLLHVEHLIGGTEPISLQAAE